MHTISTKVLEFVSPTSSIHSHFVTEKLFCSSSTSIQPHFLTEKLFCSTLQPFRVEVYIPFDSISQYNW